jgi:hypothetical protein
VAAVRVCKSVICQLLARLIALRAEWKPTEKPFLCDLIYICLHTSLRLIASTWVLLVVCLHFNVNQGVLVLFWGSKIIKLCAYKPKVLHRTHTHMYIHKKKNIYTWFCLELVLKSCQLFVWLHNLSNTGKLTHSHGFAFWFTLIYMQVYINLHTNVIYKDFNVTKMCVVLLWVIHS